MTRECNASGCPSRADSQDRDGFPYCMDHNPDSDTVAERMLGRIREKMDTGWTIYVVTHLKCWKWTPAAVKRFRDAGTEPFVLDPSNQSALLMAQGSRRVCVLLGAVEITASR